MKLKILLLAIPFLSGCASMYEMGLLQTKEQRELRKKELYREKARKNMVFARQVYSPTPHAIISGNFFDGDVFTEMATKFCTDTGYPLFLVTSTSVDEVPSGIDLNTGKYTKKVVASTGFQCVKKGSGS